jgi:UDP-2-acetamido-2-deoxy-ribo-hexuluronate aminotransferase
MKRIPMLDLALEYEHMKKDIDSAIEKCLQHQRWIFGPEVGELEERVAEYLNVRHCAGVSSGTDALVLSLRALAIKLRGTEYFDRHDEIITSPFTFTATGDAILRAGATPVFIDIDPATYNLDVVRASKYISENASSVVGIMPVHLYGLSCDMDEIMRLANVNNLFVVEDVAQAFGGEWEKRKLGSIGTAGAFSFFPSKNLGGFGDGGMIATNDDEIAELVRMLIKHGGRDKYNVDHIGYNARLDTLQAAVLLAKLKYIDEFNSRRRHIAERYSEGLKGIDEIELPAMSEGHVFHQYTIRIKGGKRDKVQGALNEQGVSSMVYYPVPLHKMKVFEGRCKVDGASLTAAEAATNEVLSLPMEPLMGDESVKRVIDAVKTALPTQ